MKWGKYNLQYTPGSNAEGWTGGYHLAANHGITTIQMVVYLSYLLVLMQKQMLSSLTTSVGEIYLRLITMVVMLNYIMTKQ